MDASEIGLALAAPAALQAGLAMMGEALAALDGAAEAVWVDALGVGPLGVRGGVGMAPAVDSRVAELADEDAVLVEEGRAEAGSADVRIQDAAGPSGGARRDSVADRAEGGRNRDDVLWPRFEGLRAERSRAVRVGETHVVASGAGQQKHDVAPRQEGLPRAAAPDGHAGREESHERLGRSQTVPRATRRTMSADPKALGRALPGLGGGRGVAAAPVGALPDEDGAGVVSRVADVIGLPDGNVADSLDADVPGEVSGSAAPRWQQDGGGSPDERAVGWPFWDAASSRRAVAPVQRERSSTEAGGSGRELGLQGQGSPKAGMLSTTASSPGGEGKGAEDLAPVLELDGRVIGQWLGERMAREASRPAAGTTFFDPRQAPAWMPSGSL